MKSWETCRICNMYLGNYKTSTPITYQEPLLIHNKIYIVLHWLYAKCLLNEDLWLETKGEQETQYVLVFGFHVSSVSTERIVISLHDFYWWGSTFSRPANGKAGTILGWRKSLNRIEKILCVRHLNVYLCFLFWPLYFLFQTKAHQLCTYCAYKQQFIWIINYLFIKGYIWRVLC